MGANIVRDFFASVTDVIGGRSAAYEGKLKDARDEAMREIEERGAEAVIDDAIAEALDGPELVYLSVDIDVLDPGMAPGTGTPEASPSILPSTFRLNSTCPLAPSWRW